MEYRDNQERLAALNRDIAEFERIEAFRKRESHAETALDAAFYSTYLPEIDQMRAERDALEEIMRTSPGA